MIQWNYSCNHGSPNNIGEIQRDVPIDDIGVNPVQYVFSGIPKK
jgi:hypothetical protein